MTCKKKFENTKGITESVKQKRTDNTISIGKRTKRQ